MGRTFCVANQKGGVGKTTTAMNLAAALARSGAQTLLVDLDPQCNATTGMGRQPTESHPLVHAAPIRQGVVATGVERLELLPGSRKFYDVELLTRDDPGQRGRIGEQMRGRLPGLRFRADRLPALVGAADEDGPADGDGSVHADPVRVFCDGGAHADDRGHPRRDAARRQPADSSAGSC